ncbi:feline leukemia virus subgroup C receptor-related protein 2-like [Leptopilina boulardi]|uniref:feline leukemia virus subgroup C receptor-related protein 2-like n=1 Tax=Leptopilina boulardi TaxID=63433 RepID=UPI0021F664C9|nr:feline leukemia virus subgroup C receptor-related protein 2-like [Leptopilina boulardi]XP_051156566.1 feline leukemia virus subgroup C receptor-related protein 2-like [Leptopilina boulardi]XP_051156567.1 feline leukemia virus subgroup C receptor-related protein 2-like [Leptopilina boulardi]
MIENENNDNNILTSYNDVKIMERNNIKSEVDKNLMKVKVYNERWFILFIFSLSAAVNYLSYAQYSIITNIITRYYGVSTTAVEWTMMIYLLLYIPLVIPATNLFEKIGIRWSLILSFCCVTIGVWIKAFSVAPNRFYIAFIGQFVSAITLVFFVSSPTRLAANWFPSEQISTAISLAIFGALLGIAIGFYIPPIVIKNHENLDKIGEEIQLLNYIYAGITTVMAIIIIIFFKEEPKQPPSAAQALLKVNRIENKEGFIEPLKRLCKNKYFLLLFNSHGLNVGVYNATATMLNPLYTTHFPNGEEEAGQIGLLIILTGMLGAVVFGILVDKTRKYKAMGVTAYFLSLLAQIIFAISLSVEVKWLIYASSIFLGFSLSGYYALGYELCVEYTYPESEFMTVGILIVASDVYGILLVTILSELWTYYGDIAAHIGFCFVLLIGFIITVFTKDEQRRENARKSTLYTTVPTRENDAITNQST